MSFATKSLSHKVARRRGH